MCGRDSIQDFKIQKILKFNNRKREEKIMKEKYKIYNFLFDGNYLKDVSLNAKVAYGIYVDMLK